MDWGWPSTKGCIPKNADLERIRDLPRRRWQDAEDLPQLVDLLSRELITAEGYAKGERLLPIQAAALRDLYDLGYLCVPAGVGEGKTLITLLAGRLLHIPPYRVVLLLEGALKGKTRLEIREYARLGFRVTTPRLVTYDQLSRGVQSLTRFPGCKECPKTHLGCDMHRPVLFMADEARAIVGSGTPKRYKRFRAYKMARARMQEPIRFIPLDGTMSDGRNLEKVARLIQWAIPKEAAPIPTKRADVRLWANAMDELVADYKRVEPGALLQLHPDAQGVNGLDRARDAFGKRFCETPGVVANHDLGLDTALLLRTVRPNFVPETDQLLRGMLHQLRTTGELPGGKIAASGFEIYAQSRALACGFYYQIEPPPPPEWIIARRQWAAVSRALLQEFGTAHNIYNEMELIFRLDHGVIDPENAWEWREYLQAWRDIKEKFKPQSIPQWVHTGMLEYCAEWLATHPRGVVWCDKRPFCERLSLETQVPYFRSKGRDPYGNLIDQHAGPAICSVKSCYKGHNIQHHHDEMLVVSAYERGDIYEQLIGRHHRQKQKSPLVICNVVLGIQEQLTGLYQAIQDAKAIQALQQRPQRLAYCDKEIRHYIEELP